MQIRHSKGHLQSKTTQLSFSIFFQFSMLGELLGEECPAQVMAQWKLTLQNRGDSVTSVTSMTERKRKFEESMVLSHHGFAQLPNWLKKISTNFFFSFFFRKIFFKIGGFWGEFCRFFWCLSWYQIILLAVLILFNRIRLAPAQRGKIWDS